MSKMHPLFHKFKAIVGYSVAIVVIVVALAVSGLRLLLTTANLYQAEVEQLASSLLLQPVKIGRMDAELSGLVPTLIFHNVELISSKTKKSLFSLSRIDIGISFKDLLLSQKITPSQLTIKGMNLHVTRTVEGSYKIKGVDLAGLSKVESTPNAFLNNWLLQQGEIGVEDSSFTWKDEQNAGVSWFFDDMNLLLKKSSERYQLLLESKLPNILGDKIKLAADIEGDITSPSTLKIKTFIDSKGFNLNPLQYYIKIPETELIAGMADFSLWLNWENESIKQLSGDLKLHDFSYRLKKRKIVTLNSASGIFDSYVNDNNTWNVSVKNFSYKSNKEFINESNFSLAFNYSDDVFESFYLTADYLKLETLSKIITDNHLLSNTNEEKIKHLDVHGSVRDFSIAWKNNELSRLNAVFKGLGVTAWQSIPELKNISGNVKYEENEGVLTLLSTQSVIGFPKVFRNNFKLAAINAEMLFSNTKQGMLFDIQNLTTKNNEEKIITSGKLWLPKNNTSPYLDLQTHITESEISKISQFLPVKIMDKSLVGWLDKSLLGGKIDKCTVVLNGKLDDFPFEKDEGIFNVAIETSGVTLSYLKDWPRVENAKIKGEFTGQGMKLHLLSAEVENNLMSDSYAEIPSFNNTEVNFDLNASGSTKNIASFLVNSPVLPEAKTTIASMRMTGDIVASMKMNIPLGEEISKNKSLTYSGSAKLNTASVYMLKDKVDITDIAGEILFTEKKLSSSNVVAKISGEKAVLEVKSLAGNKGTNISAKGKMKPGKMLKRFNIPGADKISGVTSYAANMLFPGKNSKNKNPFLRIKSNLLGVKSDLPDYFYKKPQSRQKFDFSTVFSGNNKIQLGIAFGKKGSAILELDQSKQKNFLNKGAVSASARKASLPKKNVLYIDGNFNKLTPSKWFKALGFDKKGEKQTFFVNPVVLNLDKLEILADDSNSDDGVETTSPKNLPRFEGIIKKLSWDNTFLGRLDFKVSKKYYGLRFDEIILSARNMKLFAHGGWQYSRGQHKTNMSVTLSSNNFGEMLTDLGFAAIIDKGVAKTVSNINWQSSPARFSLAKLNGTIQLNIKDGNIKEVDAEAGRLLGLFSLSALPRKLFGDFKGTFKSGFSFDSANGEITLEDGDAYVEDFEISSTVAEIFVSGRTGLVDRDYENVVEVIPEVGEGLAGITALLVNLPAGIGLWLVDKITGEQFNEASTRTYEISGTWDKPEIQKLEDE